MQIITNKKRKIQTKNKNIQTAFLFLFLCFFIISGILWNKTTVIEAENGKVLATQNSKRTLKNIVVFIEFNDSDVNVTHHLDDPQSIENAYKILNSDTPFDMVSAKGTVKVPSFKKYFERESYGDLSITSEIFPKENGTVVSYADQHPIGYYLKYNDQNTIGYTNKQEALQRETELVNNATTYIASMVENFGITGNELDTDGNGIIDAITFVVEGQENLPSAVTFNDLLWSHKLDNTGITATIAGKRATSYTFLYATDYTQTAGLFSLHYGSYGTIIHEFGHILGYRDLYRYNNSSSKPVGFYDMMGNVIGSNPQSFLAYYTSEYNSATAWHNPLPIISKTTNNLTVYKPNFIDKNEQRAIKIQTDASQKEFFIVEYHQKLDTFEDYSADQSGIIIYRINENNKYLGSSNGADQGRYDHVYLFRPGETGLGAGEGNLREATLNQNRPTFGNTTITNNTFDNTSIFYTDGTNSGIKIEVTGQTDSSITFNVIFPKTDGSGTKEDPYIISDVTSFLQHMSTTTTNKYYKLAADLDFKDVQDYPQINFDGNLDGNNKTIRNINAKNTGVFNNINLSNFQNQTTIENINLENINVQSDKGNYLGGFASSGSNVTLKNIHLISGSVTNTAIMHDLASTGGFIGNVNNSVIIENCSSNAKVSAIKNVGGFIGINMNAKIKNSFSTGQVEGTDVVGGFIGVQAISDNTYHIPENVYYNKSFNPQLKAVGGYSPPFHNLTTLDENSLGKGIRSVLVPHTITVQKNKTAEFSLTVEPNITLPYTITSEDENIIKYTTNKLLGVNIGNAKVYTDIRVGNHTMRLTTNVTVENQTAPITEQDILNDLDLVQNSGYLYGILPETNITDLKNKMIGYTAATITSVQDKNGNEMHTGLIATGVKIVFQIENKEYNYTVVIKGDVNGDGLIYATDYVKVKNHIMGKTTLENVSLKAADINGDGKVYATDYVQIKNHIMGKNTINPKKISPIMTTIL